MIKISTIWNKLKILSNKHLIKCFFVPVLVKFGQAISGDGSPLKTLIFLLIDIIRAQIFGIEVLTYILLSTNAISREYRIQYTEWVRCMSFFIEHLTITSSISGLPDEHQSRRKTRNKWTKKSFSYQITINGTCYNNHHKKGKTKNHYCCMTFVTGLSTNEPG